MNQKDKRSVLTWANLIDQLADNCERGLNAAVKDVSATQGLKNIASEMRSTAGGRR